MTVKELIAELSEFDESAVVDVYAPDTNDVLEVVWMDGHVFLNLDGDR